jgi:hypothetical protein
MDPTMTDRRHLDLASLLPLTALIVVRGALGGPPFFRGEFVGEDFILLLTLAFWAAPTRFQVLIWYLIHCLVGITMALIAWSIGARRFPLPNAIVSTVVLALLAIHSAARAVIELLKLRKGKLKGVPPQ